MSTYPASDVTVNLTGTAVTSGRVAPHDLGAERAVLGFGIGSALCAIATSTTELVLFRVLQGAGGGMIMPLAQLIGKIQSVLAGGGGQ